MKHIEIDTGKCVGHGRCYTLAPTIFEPDDEGFSVLLQSDVAEDRGDYADLLAAVANCPERAISLTDGAGE